ncbi:rab family small GTPase [Naegleria gruberi]|uniref:Rab family small GTPase n=1 Tax=Naegleria gruberi TaxID=5762 RepID=D2V3W3_NAEGR|nr:rab family small GTPase [Naegleria gruberi]EFC48423.1 rab family small GTPase [Naegleria gruberi]|eukprot:XP_002681167.1 rab family small GTPase [Naegleria gruberi strain NEG-M]
MKYQEDGDDDFEENKPPTSESFLDLAAEKVGFYEFCFQQYVMNMLKECEKEWSEKGLWQHIVLNLKEDDNSSSSSTVADKTHQPDDLLLFESLMKQFQVYKSFLKNSGKKIVEEEAALLRVRKFSLTDETFSKWKDIKLAKCCVLGCGAVGKTTFCKSLDVSKFKPHQKYLPTIGCTVSVFNLSTQLNQTESLNIALWDWAGGEQIYVPRNSFLNDSKYCIIAFDLTSKATLLNIRFFIEQVRKLVPSCIMAIVGMQSDHSSEYKITNQRLYNRLATHTVPYIEISSKLLEHNTVPLWFFFLMEYLNA